MRRGIAAPFIEGMRNFSSLELRVHQTNLKNNIADFHMGIFSARVYLIANNYTTISSKRPNYLDLT